MNYSGHGLMDLAGYKKFLDGEVAKYKDWNHVDRFINMIFSSNSQFQQCKKKRCWASLPSSCIKIVDH